MIGVIKIIYINFNGQMADIADICRLIFTLVCNFYNLSVSATALTRYSHENSVANSFFNHKNIELLIQALNDEDYATIQKILSGSIFSKTEKIFEAWNGFAYERIYFIDNVNLLNYTNYSIFEAILKAFNPMQDVLFVLTGREKINHSYVENISLKYIESNEILDSINESISFTIDSLNEIVPNKHYLKYPGLLHSFIQEIGNFNSSREIKQFYIDSFHNNASQYVKGTFTFDNVTLLLICVMKEGIPFHILQKIDFDKLKELLIKKYIVNKEGYIYPNFERWNRYIPQNVIEKYETEVISHLENFIEQDSTRREFYQCSLMEYYPEYYNKYFDSIFDCIHAQFENNKYSKVIFLCESLIKGAEYYVGSYKKMETVKYLLAFSYMHCDVSKKAQELFSEITSNYQMKPKDNLYFEAEAQVIDADTSRAKLVVSVKALELAKERAEFDSYYKKQASETPTTTIGDMFAGLDLFKDLAEEEPAVEAKPKATRKSTKKAAEAASAVKTCLITYAARNSNFDDRKIRKGDYLGMLEGKLVSNERNLMNVIKALAEQIPEEGVSFLTVISGEEASEKNTKE